MKSTPILNIIALLLFLKLVMSTRDNIRRITLTTLMKIFQRVQEIWSGPASGYIP